MGFRKRTSTILTDSKTRNSRMKGATPPVELDGDLTPAKYDALIAEVEAKLDAYNGTLATADQQGNELDVLERELKDFNSRILAGTKAKHGANSSEYEIVGGTRTSERKKSSKKKA
ncbi:MAG: hypothetical protein WBP93_13870 [Pyrinomonadaceae bacterium]